MHRSERACTVTEPHNGAAGHFDTPMAADYERTSRITLAGYDACHELAACMLVASLESGGTKRILIGGAGGTAQEIINLARLEPGWRFVGIDPSLPMLDAARDRLQQAGLTVREPLAAPGPWVQPPASPSPPGGVSEVRNASLQDFTATVDLRLGTVADLSAGEQFDGAMLIGVLHHVQGDHAKAATLKAIADGLKPGGALVIAGNFASFTDEPQMLKAMGERWRQYGDSREEVDQKLAKIREHSQPSDSESSLFASLTEAGFGQPLRFFTSLAWGAWIVQKRQ